MIVVRTPDSYREERSYIIKLLLSRFLGHRCEIIFQKRSDTSLSCSDERELLLADHLFATKESNWLKNQSLPQLPLKHWNVAAGGLAGYQLPATLPVLFGGDPDRSRFLQLNHNRVRIDLDILGSAFFMLTRYEEMVIDTRDRYGRFPAGQSIASQAGFLDRPIVNEYLDLLYSLFLILWPGFQRRKWEFRVGISHDIDRPFTHLAFPARRWLKKAAGEVFRHRRLQVAADSIWQGSKARFGLSHTDRLDLFDWLMDISEAKGIQSNFNIMTSSDRRTHYDYRHPAVTRLIRKIASRGHLLGFHPGWDTATDAARFAAEARRLDEIFERENIVQQRLGGRQHYLLWENPTTWQLWQDNGFDYDATLGFADSVGFRCGICYEYPVFNLLTRKQLELTERPLIIMDSTLLGQRYLNLGHEPAWNVASDLRTKVIRHGGTLELLWHNTWLSGSDEERDFYVSLLG